jgi:hypothetical protein
MSRSRVVEVSSRDLGRLPVGAVVITDAGDVLLVREDGATDPILPGGYPRPGCAHCTAVATRRT